MTADPLDHITVILIFVTAALDILGVNLAVAITLR